MAASTYRYNSRGSMLPSASISTMTSPVASSMPVRIAAPLPGLCSSTMMIPSHTARATSTVSSIEWPSTMITFSGPSCAISHVPTIGSKVAGGLPGCSLLRSTLRSAAAAMATSIVAASDR